MSELTSTQLKIRERIESGIRLASPALDAVLAFGDRLSRMVAPEDFEYYPIRPLETHDPAGPDTAKPRS